MENKFQRYRVVLVKDESSIGKCEYTMRCTDDVSRFLKDVVKMGEMDRECLVVIALDCKGCLIGYNVAAVGELNSTTVSPREVMKYAVLSSATGIIISHNHISGVNEPSSNDIETTKRMRQVGEIMGIPLLDHIIFTEKECYSIMRRLSENKE